MKKYKLSPWHDGSVKPVHVGVYESVQEGWFRKWGGEYWFNGDDDIEEAAKSRKVSIYQMEPWRGILK